MWPWNLTDDIEKQQGISSTILQASCIISQTSVNLNWSFSPETPYLGQNQRFFVPCDLEIWRMTLINNRAPLLCHFKLLTSFHSLQSIQPGVTVRKRPIRGKIGTFWFGVTLKFDRWPWKPIGHLFYATSSFVHHFAAIIQLKNGVTVLKRPIWVKIGDFFYPVWPWNLADDLEKK